MARPLRIQFAGALYHVISRGNERRAIVRDDADRHRRLGWLRRTVETYGWRLHAFVLMTNHEHLFVATPEPNLSAGMQYLGGSYTSYFNRRHRRSGHLFQGRFKGHLIEEEGYFLEVSRYIHLNPVRAGMVTRPQDYPWSSYCGLAYGKNSPDWFDANPVLDCLEFERKDFRRAVASYDEASEDLLSHLWYGLVLGSRKAVTKIKQQRKPSIHKEQPQSRQLKRHGNIGELSEKYRKILRIPKREYEQYFRPIRHRRRPYRDVLIYLIWLGGGFRLDDLGHYFNVSYPAISNCRRRGLEYVATDRKVRKALTKAGFEL